MCGGAGGGVKWEEEEEVMREEFTAKIKSFYFVLHPETFLQVTPSSGQPSHNAPLDPGGPLLQLLLQEHKVDRSVYCNVKQVRLARRDNAAAAATPAVLLPLFSSPPTFQNPSRLKTLV